MSNFTSIAEYLREQQKIQDSAMIEAEDIRKGGILSGSVVLPEGVRDSEDLSVPSIPSSSSTSSLKKSTSSSSSDNPYGLTKADVEKLYLEQYGNRLRDIEVQKQTLQENYKKKFETIYDDDERKATEQAYINQLDALEQEKKKIESGYYFTQPLEKYNANPYNPFTLKMSKLDAKRFDATATLEQKMAMVQGKVNATVGDIDGYHKITLTLTDADTAEMHNGILGGTETVRFAARTGKYDDKTGIAELGMFDGSDNAKALMYTQDNADKISRQTRRIRQLFGLSGNDTITEEMTDMAKTYDTYIMLKKLRNEADGIEAFNMFNMDKYKDYIANNNTFDAYVKVFDQTDKYGRKMVDIANMDTRTSMIAEAMYNPAYNAAYNTEDLMEHFQNTRGLTETALAIQEWNAEQIRRIKADATDKDGYPSELVDVLQGRIVQLLGSIPAFFDVTEEFMSKLILGEGAGAFRDYINDNYAAYRSTGVKWQTFVDYNDDMEKAKQLFVKGDVAGAALLGAQNVAMLITMSLPDMMGMAAMNALTGGISSAMGIAGKVKGFSRILDLTVRQYISGAVLSGTSQSLQDMADFKRKNGREMTSEEALRTFLMNGAGFYLESALSGRFLGRFLPNPAAALVTTGRAIAKRTAGEIGTSILEEMSTEAVQEYIQGAISGANTRTGDYWQNLAQEFGRTDEYGFNALLGAISGGVMSGISHVGTLVRMGGEIKNNRDDNITTYKKLSTYSTTSEKPLTDEQIKASHNKKENMLHSLELAKGEATTDFNSAIEHMKTYGRDIVLSEANCTAFDYGTMKSAWNDLVKTIFETATNTQIDTVINEFYNYFNPDKVNDSSITLEEKRNFVITQMYQLYQVGSSPKAGILNPLYEKELAKATGNLAEDTPIYEGYVDISHDNQSAIRVKDADIDSLVTIMQKLTNDPTINREKVINRLNPEHKTFQEVHEEAQSDSARGNDIVTYGMQFNYIADEFLKLQSNLNALLTLIKMEQNTRVLPQIQINGFSKSIADITSQDLFTLFNPNRKYTDATLDEVAKQVQAAYDQVGKGQEVVNFINDYQQLLHFYKRRLADYMQWKLAYKNKMEAIASAALQAALEGNASFNTTYNTTFNTNVPFFGNLEQISNSGSPTREMLNSMQKEFEQLISIGKNFNDNAYNNGIITEEEYNNQKTAIEAEIKVISDFQSMLEQVPTLLKEASFGSNAEPNLFVANNFRIFQENVRNAILSAKFLKYSTLVEKEINEVAKKAIQGKNTNKKVSDKAIQKWRSKHSKEVVALRKTFIEKVENNYKETGLLDLQTTRGSNLSREQYATTAQVNNNNTFTDLVDLYLNYMSDSTRSYFKQQLDIYWDMVKNRREAFEATGNLDAPTKSPFFNALYNMHEWLKTDKRMLSDGDKPSKVTKSPGEILAYAKSNKLYQDFEEAYEKEQKETEKLMDKRVVKNLFTPKEPNAVEQEQRKFTNELLYQLSLDEENGIKRVVYGNNVVYYVDEQHFNQLHALEQDGKVTLVIDTADAKNKTLQKGLVNAQNTVSRAMVDGVENMKATPYSKGKSVITVRLYRTGAGSDINASYVVETANKAEQSDNVNSAVIDKKDPYHYQNKDLQVTVNGHKMQFQQAAMSIQAFADDSDTSEVATAENLSEAAEMYNQASEQGLKTVIAYNINNDTITAEEAEAIPSLAYDWLYYLAIKESGIDINTDYSLYELTTDLPNNANFSNARAAILAAIAKDQNITTLNEFKKLYGTPTEGGYTEDTTTLAEAIRLNETKTQELIDAADTLNHITLTATTSQLIEEGLVIENTLEEEINKKLSNIFPENNVQINGVNLAQMKEWVRGMSLEEKQQFYAAIYAYTGLENSEREQLRNKLFATDNFMVALRDKVAKMVNNLLNIEPIKTIVDKAQIGSSQENYTKFYNMLDLSDERHTKEESTDSDVNALIRMLNSDEDNSEIVELLTDFFATFNTNEGTLDKDHTAIRRGYAFELLKRNYKANENSDTWRVINKAKKVLPQLKGIFDTSENVTFSDGITLESYNTSTSLDDFRAINSGKEVQSIGATRTSYNLPYSYGIDFAFLPKIAVNGNEVEALGNKIYVQTVKGQKDAEQFVPNIQNLYFDITSSVSKTIQQKQTALEIQLTTEIANLQASSDPDIQALIDARNKARNDYYDLLTKRNDSYEKFKSASKQEQLSIIDFHSRTSAKLQQLKGIYYNAQDALQDAILEKKERKEGKQKVRDLRKQLKEAKDLNNYVSRFLNQIDIIANNDALGYLEKQKQLLLALFRFQQNPGVQNLDIPAINYSIYDCNMVNVKGKTVGEVFSENKALNLRITINGVNYKISAKNKAEWEKVKDVVITKTSSPYIEIHGQSVYRATITEIQDSNGLLVAASNPFTGYTSDVIRQALSEVNNTNPTGWITFTLSEDFFANAYGLNKVAEEILDELNGNLEDGEEKYTEDELKKALAFQEEKKLTRNKHTGQWEYSDRAKKGLSRRQRRKYYKKADKYKLTDKQVKRLKRAEKVAKQHNAKIINSSNTKTLIMGLLSAALDQGRVRLVASGTSQAFKDFVNNELQNLVSSVDQTNKLVVVKKNSKVVQEQLDNYCIGLGQKTKEYLKKNSALAYGILGIGQKADIIINLDPTINQDVFTVCKKEHIALKGVFVDEKLEKSDYEELLGIKSATDFSNVNSERDFLSLYEATKDSLDSQNQTDDAILDKMNENLRENGTISETESFTSFDDIETYLIDMNTSDEVDVDDIPSTLRAYVEEQDSDEDTDSDRINNSESFFDAISDKTGQDLFEAIVGNADEDLINLSTVHNEYEDIQAALKDADVQGWFEKAQNHLNNQSDKKQAILESISKIQKEDFDPNDKTANDLDKFLYFAGKYYGDYYSAVQDLDENFSLSDVVEDIDADKVVKVDEDNYKAITSLSHFKTYLDADKQVAHIVYEKDGKQQGIIITTKDTLDVQSYVVAKLRLLNQSNLSSTKIVSAMRNDIFAQEKDGTYTDPANLGLTPDMTVNVNDTDEIDGKIKDFYDKAKNTAVVFKPKGVKEPKDFIAKVDTITTTDFTDKSLEDVVALRNDIVDCISYAQQTKDTSNEAKLKTKLTEAEQFIDQHKDDISKTENYIRIHDRKLQQVKAAEAKRAAQSTKEQDLWKEVEKAEQSGSDQDLMTALEIYTNFINKDVERVKSTVSNTLEDVKNRLTAIRPENSILTDEAHADILAKLAANPMNSVKTARHDNVWFGASTSLMEQLKNNYGQEEELWGKVQELITDLKARMSVTFNRETAKKLSKDHYVTQAMITFLSEQISKAYLKEEFLKDGKKARVLDIDDLTYDQELELLTAMMASDPSFNIMYKVSFRANDAIEIELRDEVALAMIASVNEVAKTCTDINETDAETIGRMLLGRNQLSNKEQRALKALISNSGVMKQQVVTQIGETTLSNLGIKLQPRDTDSITLASTVAENIGTFAYEMLQAYEKGLSTKKKIVKETKVKNEALRKAGFTTSNDLVFVKISHSLGLFGTVAERLNENFFTDTTYIPDIIKIRESFDETPVNKSISGGFYGAIKSNEPSRNFINQVKRIPYLVDWELVDKILTHKAEYARALGLKNEEELALMTPDEKLAAEGKNNTILSDIDTLEQLRLIMKDQESAKVYFDWEQTIAGRFQIKGSIFNPQNNKVLRGVLKCENNMSIQHTIGDSEDDAFELTAIAQAFDCMETSKREHIKKFIKDMSADVKIAEELLNDVATLSDTAIESKYNDYGIGIEERTLALQAAKHLVQRAKAILENKKTFTTNLMMENDSTTSGYFLKLLLFPHPEVLNTYGIKVGSYNSAIEYQQKVLGILLNELDIDKLKKLDGFLDIYRTGAVGVAENIATDKIKAIIARKDEDGNFIFDKTCAIHGKVNGILLTNFFDKNKVLSWDRIKQELPQAEYQPGVGYSVSSELRTLLKPVIMIFGYSAGEHSIKYKTGEELYESSLNKLREIVTKDDFSKDTLKDTVFHMSLEEVEALSGTARLFALNLSKISHDGNGNYLGIAKEKKWNPKKNNNKGGYDYESSVYNNALIKEDDIKNEFDNDPAKQDLYADLMRFQHFYHNAVGYNLTEEEEEEEILVEKKKVETPFGEVETTVPKRFSLDDVMVQIGEGNDDVVSYADAIRNYYAETYGALVLEALKPFKPFVQVNNANNLMAAVGTAVYEDAFKAQELSLLIEKNPKLQGMDADDKDWDKEVAKARSKITVGEWNNLLYELQYVFPTGANYWTKDSVGEKYTAGGISIIDFKKAKYDTVSFLTRLGVYEKKRPGKKLSSAYTNLKIFSTDSRSTWQVITGAGLRLSVFSIHSFDASVLNQTVVQGLALDKQMLCIHDALFMSYKDQNILGKLYNGIAIEQASQFDMLTSNIAMLERVLEAASDVNSLAYKYDILLAKGDTSLAETVWNNIQQEKKTLEQIRDNDPDNSHKRQAVKQLAILDRVQEGKGTALTALHLPELSKSTLMSFMNIDSLEDAEHRYTPDSVYNAVTLADLLKRMHNLAKYYEDHTTGVKGAFLKDAISNNLAGNDTHAPDLGSESDKKRSVATQSITRKLNSGPEPIVQGLGEKQELLGRADTTTEGILDLMDELKDTKRDTPEQIKRLKDLISSFLNLGDLQGWLVQVQAIEGNSRGEADITNRSILLQRQGKGFVTSKKFNQSDLTVYAHELVHALFDFAFTQQTNMRISADITRLRAVYNYVIKNKLITWEDFLYDKDAPNKIKSTNAKEKADAQKDIDFAHETYDYLFNNEDTGTDRGLKEFLSYLLTNEMMHEKFSKIVIQVGKQNRNLFEWIVDVATKIFKVITLQLTPAEAFEDLENKLSGYNLKSGVDVYTSAVNLCLDIQKANTHAGNAMERAAGLAEATANTISGIREAGNKVISPMLQSLTDIKYIGKYVKADKGGKLGIIAKALLTAPVNETSRKAVGKLFRFYGEHLTSGWINSLIDDFADGEFGIHQIERFGRKTQKLEQELQNITNQHKAWIREQFGDQLSEYDEESLSVLLRGNVSSLLYDDSSNIDDVISILQNEQARNDAIKSILTASFGKYEAEGKNYTIRSNSRLTKLVKNIATQEAATMLCGKGNMLFSSYDNGHTFVVEKAKETIDSILQEEYHITPTSLKANNEFYTLVGSKIDQLASIFYLQHMNDREDNKAYLENCSKLSKKGIQYFLEAHKAYIQDAMFNMIDKKEARKERGVVPVAKNYDVMCDIKIAPISERETYEWNRYTLLDSNQMINGDSGLQIGNLTRKPDERLGVYYKKTLAPTRTDGSVVSLIGTHDRVYHINTYLFDCLSLDKQQEADIRQAVEENSAPTLEEALNEAEIDNRIKTEKVAQYKKWIKQQRDKELKMLANSSLSFETAKTKILSSSLDGDSYNPISLDDEVSFGLSRNAVSLMSQMLATNEIADNSDMQNKVMYHLLNNYYKENVTATGHDKITDRKFVDIKKEMIEKFGYKAEMSLSKYDHFFVREDWVKSLLGVESWSISNWKWKNGKNVLPPALNLASLYLENFLRLVAFKGKQGIVVKNPKVILGNVASNINIHMLIEPNVGKIANMYKNNLTNVIRYFNEKKQYDALVNENKHTQDENKIAENTAQINRLKASLENNPAYALIKENMYTNIVEDLTAIDQENMADLVQMFTTSKAVNSIPEPVKKIARTLWMEKGTPIYETFYHINQYSDFIARLTQYQLLMEKYKGPKDPQNEDFKKYRADVLDDIWETFIDYRIPTNKFEQYLNDIGLVQFTKFFRRIQRIIKSNILKNPVGCMMQFVRQMVFFSGNIFGSAIPAKNYGTLVTNPYELAKEAIAPRMLELFGVTHITD